MPNRVTTLALAMVISPACLAQPARAAVTDDDIQQATDKGVEWLFGLYAGDKLVGVYSPFDLMYCHAGYSVWNCRGYAPDDALAILTNILLHVSARAE